MKKLILENRQSPGDIVMMTAAVHALHTHRPGQYQTDVRTPCDDLWLNNPYITSLNDADPEVQKVYCHYPLIHESNKVPHHFIFGMINHLNDQLGLQMQPRQFKGDIHLSDQEKSMVSRIAQITGDQQPYWIIDAGGKYDFTAKWWSTERYQQVVNHFKDRIRFVQIGEGGHHHPALEGVINLVGKTSLRELILLMHHAQGVLTPVSLPMHLAAAVETPAGMPPNRPCVVIAGGREPVTWEAYGHHQYIHTVGSLNCCKEGGCWKARTKRLGDGSPWDRPDQICVDAVGDLPRCLHMITVEEVCRRIEQYFVGGLYQYLQNSPSVPAELDFNAPQPAIEPEPETEVTAEAMEEKAELVAQLCESEWEYDITRYHCRTMTFTQDGKVQEGAGELEKTWELELRNGRWYLCFFDGQRKTVELARTPDGGWKGQWLTWDLSRVALRTKAKEATQKVPINQRDNTLYLN